MKKKSCFARIDARTDDAVYFHISFVNYKHVRALYGEECCAEVLEAIKNYMFIFGFSFLSITVDEMVVSLKLKKAWSNLVVEALLMFFASNNFFGKDLPIMPVLSFSEVVSDSVDARNPTSITGKSASFPAGLNPPQLTNEWRATYEAEMNFCHHLMSVLEKGKCSLNLQPIYDMSGNVLLYNEALLRFSDDRTRIDTQRAINAFERTGQIRSIDRYVLSAVIDRLKDDCSAVIACNISALSFNLDFWWGSALKDLRKYPSVADRLVIELTEGAVIDDHAAFLKFAQTLKSLGVRFALDDFGAGIPRAPAINSFAFDYIKLDKSMIRKLSCDSVKFKLILSAVNFFRDMGARVIAEGVEHEQDISTAKRLGCSYMQGYFIGRPSSKNKISITSMGVNGYSAFGLCI